MCFGNVDKIEPVIKKLTPQALAAAKLIGDSLSAAHIRPLISGLSQEEIHHLADLAQELARPANQNGDMMAHLLRDLAEDAAATARGETPAAHVN